MMLVFLEVHIKIQKNLISIQGLLVRSNKSVSSQEPPTLIPYNSGASGVTDYGQG